MKKGEVSGGSVVAAWVASLICLKTKGARCGKE